jgi:hypothetical protein
VKASRKKSIEEEEHRGGSHDCHDTALLGIPDRFWWESLVGQFGKFRKDRIDETLEIVV